MTIISLEKYFLLDSKCNNIFYDNVVNAFFKKDRRIELFYKKIICLVQNQKRNLLSEK